MNNRGLKFFVLSFFLCVGFLLPAQETVKIGIIGLDTSHSIAFTKFLNGKEQKEKYKKYKIVAAYPHGSRTIKSSYDRIPGYIEQVEALGVEVVSSIDELLNKVDCVMLETNDGNMHLEQANEVFKSGKRMFIDKPLGASLAQSLAIFELSKQYDMPIFSASSLRFVGQTLKLRNGEFGKVWGVDCYSPHKPEPSHPDFGWYGIHGVEMLFTVMGKGCVSVSRMSADSTDLVVGKWGDGRIGTFRAIQQGRSIYGGTAITERGAVPVGSYEGYEGLLDEILNFFDTGISPIPDEETIEIFTFMEASNQSVKKGGRIISMKETYNKGMKEANKLLKRL
ncbi:MAG: Gfo/Idh/MocA family oxidoreductase [bacterium]|nr:Gfo/Idh/MocA family oxidoreductase [bacterium]MDD3968524.1 Gfo/Idh/MocA family oxidoreductase [Proteiniphilum sp.]